MCICTWEMCVYVACRYINLYVSLHTNVYIYMYTNRYRYICACVLVYTNIIEILRWVHWPI